MSWLILGGVGFIGRHLVCHLVKQSVPPQNIRVVDKAIPATAYLTAEEQEVFAKIDFRQGNLANPSVMEKAFEPMADGKPVDYVVNLAAETKYGQTDEIYDERVLKIATLAAKVNRSKYIYLVCFISWILSRLIRRLLKRMPNFLLNSALVKYMMVTR